ncbi:MAG: Hsp20/alpha crystallin family protein [Chloroflexi bacterium HGW-Chloroflexi-2]|jgi:HSP20 family protein|nr:MAG: Hsp20/alpha crystallin family protein [Chloroflexi bacterium HGW-Chloroflexi-2]
MIYRRTSSPSLWEEMDKLQREMNRMFDSAFTNRLIDRPINSHDFPAMNVWTKADVGQVITAEIPGMNVDDLDIKVVGETLTISGSRQAPVDDENIRYHRQERGYGSFTRTIQLPFAIEVDKVEANYEKGVLKVWLPRAESDKPRKITVKAI